MILTGAIAGLITGAVYGLAGFWKAKDEVKETKFDFKAFLVTIIPSALVGGALGALKMPTGAENISLYLDGTAGLTITAVLKKILRV